MISYRRGMLQEGRFGWAGRSGMALGEGYFWVRRGGGYNFYAGQSARSEIDFDHPAAACGPTEREADMGGIFAAGRDCWLAARTVSRFGLESAGFAWVRLRTAEDFSGTMVPDAVENVRAGLSGRGTARLEWDYVPRLGIVLPAGFAVYVASAGAAIDFLSPAGWVNYRAGLRTYFWDSPGPASSNPVRCVIRAVTAEGIDDGSERYVLARGDPRLAGTVEGLWTEQA